MHLRNQFSIVLAGNLKEFTEIRFASVHEDQNQLKAANRALRRGAGSLPCPRSHSRAGVERHLRYFRASIDSR
jgi:hypothetical protein